ncbi:MAG: ABC transporter substrate-binding protein, partial [Mesorhizobium sp.]
MKRYRPLLHAAIAALAVIVAGPAPAFAEETAIVEVQAPLIVTDIAGREVKLSAPVKRMLLGEGRQLYLIA